MICPVFSLRNRLKKQRDLEKQRAFDDRHWNKKSLEEMVERDWRILREDFTISTKGKAFHSVHDNETFFQVLELKILILLSKRVPICYFNKFSHI